METTPTTTSPWQQSQPPQDRAIWARANLVLTDEFCTYTDPYEGYARWTESGWLDLAGMSIVGNVDTEFHCIEWMELEKRAENCPDSEIHLAGNIYHWDDETRRIHGTAGFHVIATKWHAPTGIRLDEFLDGAFPTLPQAKASLLTLLAKL